MIANVTLLLHLPFIIMPQNTNTSDTAYIQADPNCIGEHFIKARGELFEHIAKIAEEMGKIALSASKERGKSTRKLNAGEWYQNVVSILGERGSGKTILLLSACACLGKNKNLVSESIREADEERKVQHEKICQMVENDILLPVIQPEYFGSEDTLITWVLTYLKDYVDDKNNRNRFRTVKIKQYDNDDDDGVNPSEFIEEMRLSEALFSRKFSSNLAEQDVTAQDFQHETIKVIDSQFTFMRNWRKLINKLIVNDEKDRTASESTKREQHPFLIIPIDDADLNPAALPIILQQIQILQHPNVLFLFSVHKKSLHSMMYISQLELNTNRVDSRPVVNFENLIQHGLRDVEDVRVDAWNKVEKFLPRKYRVEIQPLPPKERLNFKPLIKKKKTDKGKATPTFLQLLEQIPLGIFGNKRLENITQFFDLAQSIERWQMQDILTYWYSKNIEKYKKYQKAEYSNNQDNLKRLKKELVDIFSPMPSIYVEALPKYPRAMEQVYQILSSWVSKIKAEDEDDSKRRITSLAIKALLIACLEYIPLLPRSFHQRIKFIDNPNSSSKHPIQIEFETDALTNIIKAGGEGIEINASTHGNSSRILSIYPITHYLMCIPGRIKESYGDEEIPYKIPNEWIYDSTSKETEVRSGESLTIETKYYRVPNEYFATYNLAYDLTTSNGIFGNTINSNHYKMRDSLPVSIFSVQTRTSTLFTDCYCAMPRWHRIADYNLFALAWNDLVRHVRKIMLELSSNGIMPINHVLSDWVVLSLLRIHVCIEKDYSPFLVTQAEINSVLKKIQEEHLGQSNEAQGEQNAITYDEVIFSIKKLVKDGLNLIMEGIKQESRKHALPKHHQSFKTWIEYGLPMLSNNDYVSGNLGNWITYQWIMLLITNDDGDGNNICDRYQTPDCNNNCRRVLDEKYGLNVVWNKEITTRNEHCHSCAAPRLQLIERMLTYPGQKLNLERHNSHYFLKEYAKNYQSFHCSSKSIEALSSSLQVILNNAMSPEELSQTEDVKMRIKNAETKLTEIEDELEILQTQLEEEGAYQEVIDAHLPSPQQKGNSNKREIQRHLTLETERTLHNKQYKILEAKINEYKNEKECTEKIIKSLYDNSILSKERKIPDDIMKELKDQWINNNDYGSIKIAMEKATNAINTSRGN